jgi:hypothetical protein
MSTMDCASPNKRNIATAGRLFEPSHPLENTRMQANQHGSNHPVRIRNSAHRLDIEKHSDIIEDEDSWLDEVSLSRHGVSDPTKRLSLGGRPERAGPPMMHDHR